MVLLGIDVGTTGVKVVTMDEKGRQIGEARAGYPTAVDNLKAEQDASAWWEAVQSAYRKLPVKFEISAISVTSQAPSFVLVDRGGNPLAPAVTWLDRRAGAEGQKISNHYRSRNGSDPFFGTSKILWIADTYADLLKGGVHVLSANGFITRRLTSQSVLDVTTASLMQAFDDEAGDFAAPVLEAFPALQLLPEIVSSTHHVGDVTVEAAEFLGIEAGIPVFAGAIDAVGSALEAGLTRVGDPMVEMTGFSSVAILPVPRGTHVPGLIHAQHCVPGIDLLISAQVTAGATIDWINGLNPTRDLRSDVDILELSRPGKLRMYTGLAGERTPSWNASSRGVVAGVGLDTDGFDLILAAMEGTAFALRNDLETIQQHGFKVKTVVSTGGGANSRAWTQIKADVLGIPVLKPRSGHGAAHGAAILAGLASGIIKGFGDVVDELSMIDYEAVPNKRIHQEYNEILNDYHHVRHLSYQIAAGDQS